jgi:dihydrofolate reductase
MPERENTPCRFSDVSFVVAENPENIMRTLTTFNFISLDGVAQAPGGPNEDTSGGFRFGGWIVPYGDEAIGQELQEVLAQPFELLLGRATYDIFASHWPHVPADSPSRAIADMFNSVPKHVATHRPDELSWSNSHALHGDLADAIRALKPQDGANLLTFGSGGMVRQLLAAGLIDEMRLLTYPVLLGQGKRLFGDDAQPAAFRLTHTLSTAKGVLINRYLRDGDVRTGSFE